MIMKHQFLVDKNIEAIINNIDVNASNGNITINYLDALISKIKLKNLQINEATAWILTFSHKSFSFSHKSTLVIASWSFFNSNGSCIISPNMEHQWK